MKTEKKLYCRRLDCIAAGLAAERDCIAIQRNCIVTRQGAWAGLYCNTATAPATRHWAGRCMGAQGTREARRRACVPSVQGARAAGLAGAAGARARRASGRAERWRVSGRSAGRAAGVGARGAAAGARTRYRRAGRAAGAGRGVRGGLLGVPVRAAWACWVGQLGQVGALCTWLSSDSVFEFGSTRYFSRVTK